MREIGIRQGRLSPATGGRGHQFPWQSWKDEFVQARRCGFASIEWLFAADDYQQNPIWMDSEHDEILRQSVDTGIRVRSLCADYFVVHPLLRVSDQARRHNVAVLNRLVVASARVGIEIVVVPALEAAEIRTAGERAELIDALSEPLALAAAHGVRLALETELPGPEYRALVERHHPTLGACYDTGNAAARGYDVAADVRALAPYLCGIHITDRKRNGPSVPLGQGDADFPAFFRVAAEVGYTGPLIVEAPVGEEPVSTAMAHLAFLKTRDFDK